MKTIEQIPVQHKGRRAEEWVWVFQGQLRIMAQDRRLKWTHWRVLAYIISCATFAQDLVLRQAEIGRALGLTPETMCRLFRDLDRMGIVLRVLTGQRPATYRLNARYIYKGRGERLVQRRAYQRQEGQGG
jgi:hypothetical protein